jgi:hypothetical protein
MDSFSYNIYSLLLTGIYDFLTLSLLVFVIYEAIIKPKVPNIAFYFQTQQPDIKQGSWERQVADFIFENRGIEIRKVIIKSIPDELGWGNLGNGKKSTKVQKTSEHFRKGIPYMAPNEKLQFFWCDLEANREVLRSPFEIIISFDNPIPIARFIKKRCKKSFPFDFSVYDNIVWGLTNKYDIHNVAMETARIREQLEKCLANK